MPNSLRTVPFRLPPIADLAQRCLEANRALLRIQWALEDADHAEEIIHFDTAHEWVADVRAANAALAIAAAAFSSLDSQP